MVTQKVVEPGFAPGALTLKSLLYLQEYFLPNILVAEVFILCVCFLCLLSGLHISA